MSPMDALTVGPSCPCGKGPNYRDCCGLIHSGARRATTAEQLMRSRYSAVCHGLEDYLFASHHPSQRGPRLSGNQPRGDRPTWLNLKILSTERGLDGDSEGYVEFVATYRQGQSLRQLHERSKFLFENGRWLYFDGDVDDREAPKPGRNDPCWCGSGKKFKKCCGRGGS